MFFNSRTIVPVEIAKAWVKAPKDFIYGPLVDPKEVYIINNIHVVTTESPIFKQLFDYRKMEGKVPSHKTKVRAKIISNGVSHGYNRCQLTGELCDETKLAFHRIYQHKLYCKYPGPLGYIWLKDKLQWIRKEDTRVAVITVTGKDLYYTTDLNWFKSRYTVVEGQYERRPFLKEESIKVWGQDDTGAVNTELVISLYEYENHEIDTYFACRSCGNVYIDECNRGSYCIACYLVRTEHRNTGTILNYTHRVEKDLGFDAKDCVIFKDDKGKDAPLYLGVELEYSVKNDKIPESVAFIHKTRYAQCKSDTSIQGGGGYEIVSKPCSLQAHKKNIALILEKCGSVFAAHESCGLHVHVSRKPFSNAIICKVLAFIHREANREFMLGLARRDNHRYARYTDSYIKEQKRRPEALEAMVNSDLESHEQRVYNGRKMKIHDNTMMSRERYTALNVKDKTLEFRIFKASLDMEEIMASIQFSQAIFLYAWENSTRYGTVENLSLKDWLNISNFIKFLVDSKDKIKDGEQNGRPVYRFEQRYPELLSYIGSHNLPTSSKNMQDVLVEKLKTSISQRVVPVPKYREIPPAIRDELAKLISVNRLAMATWIGERSSYVQYSTTKNAWEALNYDGTIIVSLKLSEMKVA